MVDEIDYDSMPNSYLVSGMKLYIEHGIEPGGFMMAVLSNDLREACCRADDHNQPIIFYIVKWLYNNVPYECWGTREKVEDWLDTKRKERESDNVVVEKS